VRAVAYLLCGVAAGIVAVAVGLIVATAVTSVAGVVVGALSAVAGGVWVAWAVPTLEGSIRELRRERGEDGT
jgi:hypothetical protein